MSKVLTLDEMMTALHSVDHNAYEIRKAHLKSLGEEIGRDLAGKLNCCSGKADYDEAGLMVGFSPIGELQEIPTALSTYDKEGEWVVNDNLSSTPYPCVPIKPMALIHVSDIPVPNNMMQAIMQRDETVKYANWHMSNAYRLAILLSQVGALVGIEGLISPALYDQIPEIVRHRLLLTQESMDELIKLFGLNKTEVNENTYLNLKDWVSILEDRPVEAIHFNKLIKFLNDLSEYILCIDSVMRSNTQNIIPVIDKDESVLTWKKMADSYLDLLKKIDSFLPNEPTASEHSELPDRVAARLAHLEAPYGTLRRILTENPDIDVIRKMNEGYTTLSLGETSRIFQRAAEDLHKIDFVISGVNGV